MLRRTLLAALALLSAPAMAQEMPDKPAAPLPGVLVHTSAGDMTVEADTADAPITAANFLKYVDQKKLDGVVFYRVVKVQEGFGFVQFGLLGNPKKVNPPIKHEPTTETGLSHTDGVLSIARFKPGSAQADFTIMVGDQSGGLDAGHGAPEDNLGYAAFGRVVAGREVLVKILDTPIEAEKTSQGAFKGEMPGDPVTIISARRLAAR